MRLVWILGLIAPIAACAGDAPPPPPPAVMAVPVQPSAASAVVAPDEERIIIRAAAATNYGTGRLTDYLDALSARSCPDGTKRIEAVSIPIQTSPAELKAINPLRSELTFVAGFQIGSSDRRFGGLSGLDILDNGNLLAVSDAGDFVWIDLAPDGVTPVAARLSRMHDVMGAPLNDAADSDAEGLAMNDGMALVSFEFNHRILAFNLGKCGPAARGVPIAFGPYGMPLPKAFDLGGLSIDENEGVEALGITNDWYLFAGSEGRFGEQSMMSARPIEAEPDFDLRVGANAPDFAGMDVLPAAYEGKDVRAFMLYRSFSPLAGAVISIIETDYRRHLDSGGFFRRFRGEIDERSHNWFVETGWREFAKLDEYVAIDNFEGIAAREMPDGRVRLYIISDDNFSNSQRTLLMVLDTIRPLR
jgi:hypothetical protein